jgi:hypothetical protein
MKGIDGLLIMDYARIKNTAILNRYKHLSPKFNKTEINKMDL